ncbi:MAG: glycosyltransferase WbuB [Lysobacterales bacterium]|nr:MAG: glycosyltransferase WbuB [Xanthomonadales bacterium]
MTTFAHNTRKTLIVVENLPVPFDRRVWQEALALRKAGYQVSIICPTGKGHEARHEVIDDIHIYRHPLPAEAEDATGYLIEYSAALFWEFILAWRILISRGFDVIHACNPPDNIFLVAAMFKLLGKKFLFDHHDICPELYEAKFKNRGVMYKAITACERWTFKTADVSVATSQSYKRIAIERGGMDPNQVFVVRNGPTLDRLRIIPPVPRLKMGRKYLVGYVGVMGKQDGIDYLLRAVRHIVQDFNRTDVHFGLVGGGTEWDAMKRYAEELGIADYVTLTGRVPDQEMLEMLNTADVCVNPDVANEMNDKSCMNKVMEYMALAKPIVQFDLTEGRVSAQEASLYAIKNDELDFARKIIQLMDDSRLRKRMGEYGRKRVLSELLWEQQVPYLLAAYDQLYQK